MKKIIWLVVVLLLSSCSFSEYNKSMEAGKEYLKNREYEKAESEFSNALIEKPTSIDAKTLLESSRNERIEASMKDKIKEYILENRGFVAQLLSIKSQSPEQITLDIQKLKFDDLLEIQKKSGNLLSKYKEYTKITDVHNIYMESLKYQIEAQTNVLTLLKSLSKYSDDEIINDPKVIEAQDNMKNFAELSNESIMKYSEEILKLQNEYGVEIEQTE